MHRTPNCVVRDIELAAQGRHEIDLAESEMPGPDGLPRGIRTQ